MDELFWALLYGAAELLFEVFFQIAVESILALIVRSMRDVFEKPSVIGPILAAVGYLFLGIIFGIASLHLLPHPLFHPSKFHGISLVISRYGFTFALGMALIRFIFAG